MTPIEAINEVRRQGKENKPYVKLFCRLYDVKLLNTAWSFTEGNELVYTFSNDLGYFTITGIKRSIEEKLLSN
jgi:hypothetical protein